MFTIVNILSSEEKTKVLSVRLPASHPIWDYAPRKRTQMAKEFIDQGLSGEGINPQLNNTDLSVLISRMINSLEKIEEAIKQLSYSSDTQKNEEKKDNDNKKNKKVDPMMLFGIGK